MKFSGRELKSKFVLEKLPRRRKGCLNDLVARGVWPDGAIQTESRAFKPGAFGV